MGGVVGDNPSYPFAKYKRYMIVLYFLERGVGTVCWRIVLSITGNAMS